MTPFVIVADLRTGSTLISTSLDRHPQVRCYGELFHPDDLPDNRIPGRDRYRETGEEVIRHALSARDVRATGFRAMVFLPLDSHPQWADAWSCLHEIEDLRVLYLERRNRLAQYVSVSIAHATGVYHPPPGHPILERQHRPTLRVDPDHFQGWIRERDALFQRRRDLLDGKPSLDLSYETLVDDWPRAMRRVQEFLRVDPMPLAPTKRKQETRPLSEVVTNYAQVASLET